MDEVDQVHESYDRCISSPDFIADFYRHFTAKDPHILQKFENTDMSHQINALKHGLQYMIMFTSGSKIAAAKVDDLALTHDRNHRNIHPDMYDAWLGSLLETIKEHDPQYTEVLGMSWRNVLSHGIQRMKAKF